MALFSWVDGEVPNGMKVTQVYGLIFTRDGRLLLRRDGEHDPRAGDGPDV